jgi:hypothetical protein
MKLSTGDHKTRDQKPDHFLRPGCTETVGRETNPETRTLCVSSGPTLNALGIVTVTGAGGREPRGGGWWDEETA